LAILLAMTRRSTVGLTLLAALAAPAAADASTAAPSSPAPTPEGPAPPPASAKPTTVNKPVAEGPALPPEPTGARTTTSRAWLKNPKSQAGGDPRGAGGLGLTRTREGTYLYVDPGKRFTVVVNPDGGVRFGDRWGRDQHGERMKGSGWALRQIGPSGIGLGGPTEWLRALSQQELDASAKAEFLNQTRDLRIALAVEFTRNLLRTRLSELEGELMAISNDADMPLPERRALLFQRWDECDERFAVGRPGAGVPDEALSEIDRDRLTAADTARRAIEAFIRRQHPRGSPRGYTAAELAEFNRRRVSAETFAPYDRKPDRP
jgi:hypothetical protein